MVGQQKDGSEDNEKQEGVGQGEDSSVDSIECITTKEQKAGAE